MRLNNGNTLKQLAIKLALALLTSTIGVLAIYLPAEAAETERLSEAVAQSHSEGNRESSPVEAKPSLDELVAIASPRADKAQQLDLPNHNQTEGKTTLFTTSAKDRSGPTPLFSQAIEEPQNLELAPENELSQSTLDEMAQPSEIDELQPPQPINSQIINEGVQEEAAGELDDAIIRSAPEPLFQEDVIYRIQVSPLEEPQVRADKRSTIKIGGSVTTEDGQLLDNDVVVTLTASAGEFIDADYDIDRAGFQILARRGEFETELRSSLDAQRVLIRASAARDDLLSQTPQPLEENLADNVREIEAYTEVSFTTALRPSLVTGVIDLRLGNASTNFWGSFEDFLDPDDIGETAFDARAAVFGTGKIGDWLFTGAYNSDRNLNERCDNTRLYVDIQACEQTYPVYGDSSTNDYLTPSIDSLYLRFQQDAAVLPAEPNFFMWGDYSTNEFSRPSQLFSATSRQLHGFIGNYTIGASEDSGLQLTAMYANNIRPFKRDTIAPDGTSGYYFLSEPLVLAGSEEIYIETEELNRPGTVVERVALTRGADYRIDYDRGRNFIHSARRRH